MAFGGRTDSPNVTAMIVRLRTRGLIESHHGGRTLLAQVRGIEETGRERRWDRKARVGMTFGGVAMRGLYPQPSPSLLQESL